jgi:hypothetical protein
MSAASAASFSVSLAVVGKAGFPVPCAWIARPRSYDRRMDEVEQPSPASQSATMTAKAAWGVAGRRFRTLVLIVPLIYVLFYPLYKLFDPLAIIGFGLAATLLCMALAQQFHPSGPMSRAAHRATLAGIGLSVLVLAAITLYQLSSLMPKTQALDHACRALQTRMLRVGGDEPAATTFQALGCRPQFVRRPASSGVYLQLDGDPAP